MMTLKSKMVAVSAILALALSACATTNTSTPQAAVDSDAVATMEKSEVAEAELDYDPNRKVCKRQSIPGSNFKKKVCMTLQQWKDMQTESRAATSQIQNNNRGFEPQR